MKNFWIFIVLLLGKSAYSQVVGTPYIFNGLDTVRILIHNTESSQFHPGGVHATKLTDKYLEADNFGINGTFKCLYLESVFLTDLGDTITAELLEDFDLYIVIFIPNHEWITSELVVIKEWIDEKGGALIAIEDEIGYNRIGDYFGLSSGLSYYITGYGPVIEIDEPSHPIFNNTFGIVDTLFSEWLVGHYTFPLPTDFTSLAKDTSINTTHGNSVIASYNNGKAIFLTDHGFCTSTLMNDGGTITTQTEIFWVNLLSWSLRK